MRNKIDLKLSGFCLLLCLFLFSSCEEELDKYYEVPGWLKGNAKEVLEKKGNFSVFLEAVDKVGYTTMISGKGIITVIAPTDEAFKAWFVANGYSSLNDVPKKVLEKVVAYHLIWFSYDKQKLANYQPDGLTTTEQFAAENAGMYYKFRTKSKDTISIENDPTVEPGQAARSRKVYHNDRFVPVLSSWFFSTKGIDAAYNYKYFYPKSEWTGQNGGFVVSNASVSEYAIVADNGYVYVVDKVVEPLETVYDELKNSSEYSDFLSMYNRFTYYIMDPRATADYGGPGDTLYTHFHLSLPLIASEWTTSEVDYVPTYNDIKSLSRWTYNVFAPSNAAIQTFFDSFWKDYYTSIEDVPFIPLKYLLLNHAYQGDVVFPEEITRGKIITNFGTPISFDPVNTSLRKICSNGTVYGLTSVNVPRMFQSVTAPLFRNPDYTAFLHMMDKANLVPSLMTDNAQLALFIPTDHTLITNTMINSYGLQYSDNNPNLYGKQTIEIENNEGGYDDLSVSRMVQVTNNHVGARLISSSGTSKIYKTLTPYQYLLLDESTTPAKVYSSDVYNNLSNRAPNVKKIYDAYNGTAYELYGEDAIALLPDANYFRDQIMRNTPPTFTSFKDLLTTAKFNLTTPPFSFLLDRFIVFVPTNDAIAAGKTTGKIPTDEAALADYLKYYFVNVATSSLADYPFPGAGVQGELNTYKVNAGRVPTKLTIIDTGSAIQVRDAKGNIANVVSVFPYIYGDGAAYQIDGLLEFE
ncbi:fasciclin domain-containing protein [Viscerimonas tarda]